MRQLYNRYAEKFRVLLAVINYKSSFFKMATTSWPTKIYVSQYTLQQQVQRPQNYEFLLIIYILRRTVLAIIYLYIYYFWQHLQMYTKEQFLLIGHSILLKLYIFLVAYYVVDKRIFWKILLFVYFLAFFYKQFRTCNYHVSGYYYY